jgi:hypothetical protein
MRATHFDIYQIAYARQTIRADQTKEDARYKIKTYLAVSYSVTTVPRLDRCHGTASSNSSLDFREGISHFDKCGRRCNLSACTDFHYGKVPSWPCIERQAESPMVPRYDRIDTRHGSCSHRGDENGNKVEVDGHTECCMPASQPQWDDVRRDRGARRLGSEGHGQA